MIAGTDPSSAARDDALVAVAFEAATGNGPWERDCATLAEAFDLWGV